MKQVNPNPKILDAWFNNNSFYSKQLLEDETAIIKQGESRALNIFKEAAKRVPAYKKFLKKNKINPSLIRSIKDLKQIPCTDKKNYIDLFSLKELVWDGKLTNNPIINSSSGTTGNPYFWPCSLDQMVQGAIIKEVIYKQSFEMDMRETLLIICFGMGTWIAGSYTLATSQLVSQKGYKLTCITPGFNKEETIKILNELAPQFEQVVIAGIPTFIKDLLETYKFKKGTKRKIRLLFAGEGFSENWREYILSLIHSNNQLTDSVSILGSAETAIMAFETPASILIRKMAQNDMRIRLKLFNDERVPSLHNYIPSMRFFEVEDGELILTADRSIPLIRYNMHDQGGVLLMEEVGDKLQELGFDLKSKLKELGVKEGFYDLPFVYTFGRGKFATTLYGVNIYSENVREVLLDRRINKSVTGRFITETLYDNKQDQYLQIHVELIEEKALDQRLEKLIADIFVNKVKLLNSEYRRMSEEYRERAIPRIILHKYGDNDFFPKNKIKKTS